MFEQLSLPQRPPGVNLSQFLLDTKLTEETLSAKYSLEFEDENDEISPVRACLIRTRNDRYFLVLARPAVPESSVSVYGVHVKEDAVEELTFQIEEFVDATHFEAADISYRIDARYTG